MLSEVITKLEVIVETRDPPYRTTGSLERTAFELITSRNIPSPVRYDNPDNSWANAQIRGEFTQYHCSRRDRNITTHLRIGDLMVGVQIELLSFGNRSHICGFPRLSRHPSMVAAATTLFTLSRSSLSRDCLSHCLLLFQPFLGCVVG